MTKHHWTAPHRVWTFAAIRQWRFGFFRTPFVRGVAFGPFVVALTDLRGGLRGPSL